MSGRDDDYWVAEMVRIIELTKDIVARGEDVFFDANNMVEFSAARMSIIDLDVAAERLTPAYRRTHPEIEWRALARARDKYAHHYENIDREVVWNLLTRRLPQMQAALAAGSGPS